MRKVVIGIALATALVAALFGGAALAAPEDAPLAVLNTIVDGISEMMTKIDGLVSGVTNVQDAIDTVNAKVDVVQSSVDNLASDVSAIQGGVADMATDVANTNSDVETLKTDMAGIRESINSLADGNVRMETASGGTEVTLDNPDTLFVRIEDVETHSYSEIRHISLTLKSVVFDGGELDHVYVDVMMPDGSRARYFFEKEGFAQNFEFDTTEWRIVVQQGRRGATETLPVFRLRWIATSTYTD